MKLQFVNDVKIVGYAVVSDEDGSVLEFTNKREAFKHLASLEKGFVTSIDENGENGEIIKEKK